MVEETNATVSGGSRTRRKAGENGKKKSGKLASLLVSAETHADTLGVALGHHQLQPSSAPQVIGHRLDPFGGAVCAVCWPIYAQCFTTGEWCFLHHQLGEKGELLTGSAFRASLTTIYSICTGATRLRPLRGGEVGGVWQCPIMRTKKPPMVLEIKTRAAKTVCGPGLRSVAL